MSKQGFHGCDFLFENKTTIGLGTKALRCNTGLNHLKPRAGFGFTLITDSVSQSVGIGGNPYKLLIFWLRIVREYAEQFERKVLMYELIILLCIYGDTKWRMKKSRCLADSA